MSASPQDSKTSPEERDPRRKKILFRCQHRGMKEMDLLLGGFVEARIDSLNEEELVQLEELLPLNDQDLCAWMTGRKPLPSEWDTPLYRQIISFHEEAIARLRAEKGLG